VEPEAINPVGVPASEDATPHEPEAQPAAVDAAGEPDHRARQGLFMAWIAFYAAIISWIVSLVYIVGYRRDLDTAPWLVYPALGLSLIAAVLARVGHRRVRYSNPVHASLDFVSSVAWHIAWTSLVLVVLDGAIFYSTYKADVEMEQFIEGTT
jgi:hypothetical protein